MKGRVEMANTNQTAEVVRAADRRATKAAQRALWESVTERTSAGDVHRLVCALLEGAALTLVEGR